MFDNANQLHQTPPPPTVKKESLGAGKKIILAICMGLFFGIFGGIGFQAVTTASDFIFDNINYMVPQDKAAPAAIEVMGEATSINSEEPLPSIKTSGLLDSTGSITAVVTDVTAVVERVMPSVVSVSNIYSESNNIFGRDYYYDNESSGSGIIVGENETEILIVTNYHVVQDANSLSIQFVDGSVSEALVKGSQPNMDLAVVAVKLEDLSRETIESIAIATLGDSDILKVGEPSIAIGNAMGYGQSVTTGVISALDRETSYFTGYGSTSYQIEGNFIQTDAAINPGNSGGALLNIKGEVIGINSSKIGGTTIEGMGYAIPISAAKPIIAELMLYETKVMVAQEEQGFIGITGITVGDEISEPYGIPKGVHITIVYEDTPAQKYGLKEGDIITHFDGIAITSWEELHRRLAYYRAGEEISITFNRGDATRGYVEMEIDLILAGRNED